MLVLAMEFSRGAPAGSMEMEMEMDRDASGRRPRWAAGFADEEALPLLQNGTVRSDTAEAPGNGAGRADPSRGVGRAD